MRGRKIIPTAVNSLRGNPGKRRPNHEEPKPEVEAPDVPKFLSKTAKIYWAILSKELLKLRILAKVDVGVFAARCSALANLNKAEKGLKKGFVIKTKYGLKKSPWIGIAEKARDQIVKTSAELGLSASSRSRIKVTPKKPEDRFAEFLKRRQQIHGVKK